MVGDVNSAGNCFKEYLTSVVNTHVPLIQKQVRGKENPWMCREIKLKMISRDYYLRCAKRTNSELNWSTYKTMRNNVSNCIRHAKANYVRKLFRENISKSERFLESN